MISLQLFDDTLTTIDRLVMVYVNDNLKEMIRFFIDYLEMDDGFEIQEKLIEIFPRNYVNTKPEECKNIIYELMELVSSDSIRTYIKPKYEYALYYIIKYWIDIISDSDQDLIPIELSAELEEAIKKNEDYLIEDEGKVENVILPSLQDINEYLYFCFNDWDFLCTNIDNMVNLYLRSPRILSMIFPDINLDDYLDFMSVDLRDLYLEKKNSYIKPQIITKEWSEEAIIKEINTVIKLLTNNLVEINNWDEVKISNEIYRMTKRLFKKLFGIEIERESTIGRAKKKLGENDFYIYENNDTFNNIAIGENKYLEGFKKAYGQLLGYLNYTFKFGFTISISKTKNISDSYNIILRELNNIKDNEIYDNFKLREIIEDHENYIIKSIHSISEDASKTMNLYHLILVLNDTERQNIAIEARS